MDVGIRENNQRVENDLSVKNLCSIEDVEAFIKQKNISHIKVGLTDLNGVMRSKYMSRKKFLSALTKGFGFCDVVVGSDIDDQLIDGLNFTGWQSGYPDALVKIIPESAREMPFEPGTLLFLCEFDADRASLCPRHLLKRVIERAHHLDHYPVAGMEFEFSLFKETPESIREKNYHNLQSITPGNFGYSMLRTSAMAEFYQELLQVCESMDIELEGLHTEIGPGVLEAAIAKGPMLEIADQAILFKQVVKTLAHRRGWVATFMAKWAPEHQGQSGHIHLSLNDAEANNVFYDPKQQHRMSTLMQHFVAGQQMLMADFLPMVAPFINSYARLVPDYWAPTQASWGVDNRTCSIRVITGDKFSQRLEYRIPGADCNPYLAMAAALASGLWGVEHGAVLSDVNEGNAYTKKIKKCYQLPTSLEQASLLFKSSSAAIDYFGQAFVYDFATTRQWEVIQSKKAVTDWQLSRYFELA